MKVHSKRVYIPCGESDVVLDIQDGKICSIVPYDGQEVDLDFKDKMIIPGIIDTHNHGTMGYSLMESDMDTEKMVRGYLKGLASQGVTACLPTADISCFSTIADLMDKEVDGAIPLGIHSEGPWLNRVGEKGVDTGHPDITLDYAKKMVNEAKGKLKLVAIAPEIPGAKEVIKYFTSLGIRCSYAHSNMNYEEAKEAFTWGITVTTHTANVMSGIHHRNMGGLGACLLDDKVYNELICDGLHVRNEMIDMMFRIKKNPFDKFLMISDNIPFAGAPVGKYQLADMFEVNITEDGYCLTDTGRLCGSTVPVIGGIKNLYKNMHIGMENIVKMSSRNPAILYGANNKGTLDVGKDADFVVLSDDIEVLKTYREGKCVYDKEIDVDLLNHDLIDKLRIS